MQCVVCSLQCAVYSVQCAVCTDPGPLSKAICAFFPSECYSKVHGLEQAGASVGMWYEGERHFLQRLPHAAGPTLKTAHFTKCPNTLQHILTSQPPTHNWFSEAHSLNTTELPLFKTRDKICPRGRDQGCCLIQLQPLNTIGDDCSLLDQHF